MVFDHGAFFNDDVALLGIDLKGRGESAQTCVFFKKSVNAVKNAATAAVKAKQTSGDVVTMKVDRNGRELALEIVIPQPTEVETVEK